MLSRSSSDPRNLVCECTLSFDPSRIDLAKSQGGWASKRGQTLLTRPNQGLEAETATRAKIQTELKGEQKPTASSPTRTCDKQEPFHETARSFFCPELLRDDRLWDAADRQRAVDKPDFRALSNRYATTRAAAMQCQGGCAQLEIMRSVFWLLACLRMLQDELAACYKVNLC